MSSFVRRPHSVRASYLVLTSSCFLFFCVDCSASVALGSRSKHGRVCMLACLGLLVQEFFTFPFYKNAPHLATSGHDYGVKVGGMVHILMAVVIWEALTTPAVVQMINGGDRKPGYFGFDPLNLGKNPAFAVNEVKNGRLAMIGIGGMIHQQWMTNQGSVEQLLKGNFLPHV